MSAEKSTIVVAIVGAVATVIAAWIGNSKGKVEEASKVRYTVYVIDQLESVGVPSAGIALNVDSYVFNEATDTVGKYTFALDSSFSNKLSTVRVQKAGYKNTELQQTVPAKEGTLTIRMERLTNPAPVAVTASAAAPVRVSEVAAFSSGPKSSGSMANFSNWYELCSGPLPANSVIERAAFTLSGDRTCGAWAECRLKESLPGRVCWEFRMQGHNEWQPPGQANSEGNLRVEYTRPGQ